MSKVPLQESLFTDLRRTNERLERIERSLATTSTVRGEVLGSGVIARGTGFEVNRIAQGNYEVVFDNAFRTPPVVVLGVGPSSGIGVRLAISVPVSVNGFRAIVYDIHTTPELIIDGAFDFIATPSS